jgi:hypothetical protein
MTSPTPARAAEEAEPEYRYALYDLLTRSVLTEHMPFTVPDYSRSLVEAGQTSPTLNVRDRRVLAFEPWDRTRPRRTTVVILRDEVVVGEYLIWARPPYKPSEGKLNISASEVRSYFDHRLLRPTAGVGKTKTLSFDQVDQLAIFRALLADAQAVTYNGLPVGDLAIEMDATQMSGVKRDRKDTKTEAGAYHGYDFATYGELLDRLADVDGGFEWRIDSFLDANRSLRRALRLGYPYLGHPPNDDAVVLEYPGAVVVPSLTVKGRPNVSPGDYVKVRISDPFRFPGSDLKPFETFMRAIEVTTSPGPPERTTIAVEAPRTPGDAT